MRDNSINTHREIEKDIFLHKIRFRVQKCAYKTNLLNAYSSTKLNTLDAITCTKDIALLGPFSLIIYNKISHNLNE